MRLVEHRKMDEERRQPMGKAWAGLEDYWDMESWEKTLREVAILEQVLQSKHQKVPVEVAVVVWDRKQETAASGPRLLMEGDEVLDLVGKKPWATTMASVEKMASVKKMASVGCSLGAELVWVETRALASPCP